MKDKIINRILSIAALVFLVCSVLVVIYAHIFGQEVVNKNELNSALSDLYAYTALVVVFLIASICCWVVSLFIKHCVNVNES